MDDRERIVLLKEAQLLIKGIKRVEGSNNKSKSEIDKKKRKQIAKSKRKNRRK